MDSRWRIVLTGVLLGIAGAAILEFAKSVLRLALIQFPEVEVEVFGTFLYILIALVSLMMAAIALRASAIGTALLALPVVILGIAVLGAALVFGIAMGWLPGTATTDGRQVGRTMAVLGAAVLLLALAAMAEANTAAAAAWVGARIARRLDWLSHHIAVTFAATGGVLLILGLVLAR